MSPTSDSDSREESADATARRVVLSYPADLSAWGRKQVSTPHFRAYLRKVHESAEPGDTWPEFVGVGCCGDSLDVPLRVERVDGGSRVDEATGFEYEERAACGLDGGWRVQSAGGPRR